MNAMLLGSGLLAAATAAPLPPQEGVYPPGVTKEVHEAIGRGTEFLARSQANDGSWRNAGGYGAYPVAMTGFAAMALLAGGSTPTRGRHYHTVRKAAEYLKKQCDPETGLIAVLAEEGRPMFGHGYATLFLASVYGMEEDVREQERLKRVLDKAVALTSAAQSAGGGWMYMPDANNDEGAGTITQIQALRACRMAGIVVDKKTIDRAIDYIKRCQEGDGGIRYRISGPAGSRPAISAAGVAVLYNAGIYDDQPFVEKAVAYCKKHIHVTVEGMRHHYYAHLYWSQALYQRGGADWTDYYAKMSAWLLRQQAQDGSWNGDGIGTVYGTAVALLILQLPYAYAPIYQR